MSSKHVQSFSLTGRLVVLGLFACLLLPLAGCGKKGAPLPPLRDTPMTTRDLEIRQQGRQILLEMAYPNTTIGGMTLGGIDSVELLEMTKPVLTAPPAGDDDKPSPLPTADAREFEAAGKSVINLQGSDLAAAVVGDRIQIRLPLAEDLPEPPVANIFAVRTTKGEEISAISNRVTLVPIEPPAEPRNLDAEGQANGVLLTWESDESPEGFDIFRREAQVRGYGEPIRRIGGDLRRYRDASARFDRRYIYTVRAVARIDPLIHSDEAGEREIEYIDRFPPPLPRNLVALAEQAAIRLRWDPSASNDVAGYIIYRREPGRNFQRITPELVQGSELLDRNLTSGFTYGYRIQVVDQKGNESKLSAPVETAAR